MHVSFSFLVHTDFTWGTALCGSLLLSHIYCPKGPPCQLMIRGCSPSRTHFSAKKKWSSVCQTHCALYRFPLAFHERTVFQGMCPGDSGIVHWMQISNGCKSTCLRKDGPLALIKGKSEDIVTQSAICIEVFTLGVSVQTSVVHQLELQSDVVPFFEPVSCFLENDKLRKDDITLLLFAYCCLKATMICQWVPISRNQFACSKEFCDACLSQHFQEAYSGKQNFEDNVIHYMIRFLCKEAQLQLFLIHGEPFHACHIMLYVC